MQSSLKRNLQIGFGFSLVLLIISSIASYTSIKSLLSSSREVSHTSAVISELEGLMSVMKDAETSQRGFLLTGDVDYLEFHRGAYKKVLAGLNKIKSLSSGIEEQERNQAQLRDILLTRLEYSDQIIQQKKSDSQITMAELGRGKKYMDEARVLTDQMIENEQRLLAVKTANMNRFATFTPFLILIAAILSIFITIFSYLKVKRNFADKVILQAELEAKEKEVSARIDLIKNLSEQISSGDYELRINDSEQDNLGGLAVSLDKMAHSLQHSFKSLHDKERLQKGVAELNQTMVGDKDVQAITDDLLAFIVNQTQSQVAALYLLENNAHLRLQSGYSLHPDTSREKIPLGSGLLGQAALDGIQVLLTDITEKDLTISFASGELKPKNVLIVPIFYNRKVIALMELGSINNFTHNELDFVKGIIYNIGIGINSAQIRSVQQQLLDETQAQSEELQNQHSEMQNLNADLEMQTQRIQASEEELRVQQEELLQSNQELEEKSRLLEEKNHVIVERNLDIQHKSEQLELSTKYKSEFLANMSHELRTPLNSILLLSRLMSENEKLNKEEVEYAQVIQNAGQSLLSLIDEILDLSKIEAGKMELEYSSLKIKEIASDMRSLFEPLTKEKGLEMNIIVAESTPEFIISDKMRLEQILKNLLSNAIKFTANGEVELKISQPENSSHIHFSVKDSGIGIATEKQHLVFEAFQQADGSTRRKFGGTGLGLSISRELAKLMGGEIRLESTPGVGSEFTFLFPAATLKELKTTKETPLHHVEISAAKKPRPTWGNHLPIPASIPDDRNIIKAGDRVILIIEDDTAFAQILMNYSRENGYKCLSAVRGDDGIEVALKYKPLAILLDIQLPVKDGWQVMQELKDNSATRHIPVHIMSSLEVKKESILKGAIDFINKPVALEQMSGIFARIEEALKSHPKKVLIVEENPRHAKALGYFLENFHIKSEISSSVAAGINILQKKDVDCVILDMGIPDQASYETLEQVRSTPGFEKLPIILFTGKNLSISEEGQIKNYASSIVVKTAHSYQRILDEVGLFLNIVEDNAADGPKPQRNKTLKALNDILQDKTVLIADDDVRNIFSLTKSLEKHNMKIISAIDGKEALKQLEENPLIDIVLMDMMMPEMDGYESISRIRQNLKYKNLPILAVTAKAMMGDRERCIEAGASDYISKPVDADQLISLLRVWLYDTV